LLAHGRWFFPGTQTSSTTKTGRHDIAEILLKVTLNTINQIKSNQIVVYLKKVNILMKLNSIQGPGGSMSSWITYQLMQACHQYGVGSCLVL
jgi:hypothetical protein